MASPRLGLHYYGTFLSPVGALDREEAQDTNASVLEMFLLGSKGKERTISSLSNESYGIHSKVKRWARWGTHSVPMMQLINGYSNDQ